MVQNVLACAKGGPEKTGDRPSQTDGPSPNKKWMHYNNFQLYHLFMDRGIMKMIPVLLVCYATATVLNRSFILIIRLIHLQISDRQFHLQEFMQYCVRTWPTIIDLLTGLVHSKKY